MRNENIDCDLEYIGNLISEGFTSGYYPYWKLSISGMRHDELGEITLNHISKLVAGGYIVGEVIESCHNITDSGWWKLQT